MPASSLASDASAAFTSLSGAISDLYTTATTDPAYGALEQAAGTAVQNAIAAVQTFNAAASILAAVNVTWEGASQTMVELCAKLYSLMSSALVGLSATQAADVATIFASVVNDYQAMGQ